MNNDDTTNSDPDIGLRNVSAFRSYSWQIINKTLFRLFPNTIKWPRIFLLRMYGAKIAFSADINRTANIKNPWNLVMGKQSTLGANTRTCCLGLIEIGDSCRIGSNVNLLTGIKYNNGLDFGDEDKAIRIENGCWISSGSSVLQGVKLGNYTMVAEKSVVIESTSPFTAVAGEPAHEVKKAIVEGE